MIFKNFNKRAPYKELFLIILCLFLTSFVEATSKDLEDISNSAGWKALLYYQNDDFLISDNQFYLSDNRDLKDELKTFFQALSTERKQEVICRFPARYFFLAGLLNLSIEELNHCQKLTDFKQRAPLERVFVMFASENISLPSSMMGHIFLKITGTNSQDDQAEHAISFYTDVDGINFPKLIVESIALGKKGLYALSPSEPVEKTYVLVEGRNVWEFELKLSEKEKALLHYHLYELKDIKLTYYFHLFNCATLIKQLVEVAYPISEDQGIEWTTPLDVVRFISRFDLIASQSVNLSNKWKIKSLIDSTNFEKVTLKKIKDNDTQEVIEHLKEKDESYQFKSLELLKTYNDYLLERGEISLAESEQKIKEISNKQKDEFLSYKLDFSQYKNPRKTKSTAQIVTSYANENDDSIAKLTLLPGSHMIEDESSQYVSESELQISRLTLAQNLTENKLYVDEFNLYSATSLLPSDIITNGLSGRFKIGYTNYFNYDFQRTRSIVIEGKLGKTYRIHDDIDYYGLLGVSYLSANEALLAPAIETGLVLRAIYDMKTIFSLGYVSQDINRGRNIMHLKARHFIDLGGYGFVMEYHRLQTRNDFIQNYSLGIKKYF